MRFKYLVWVAVPVLVGAASYLIRPHDLERRWKVWTGSDPIIEFPQSLDLGEREVGEIAVARFAVVNRGGSELVIDQVRTNCACSGLEREEGGQFVRIDNLRLGPRERIELAMRLSVRGQPGKSTRNSVSFHTNDPTRPEASIEAVIPKVTGGISAVPTSVLFGTVPVGAKTCQVFEVRDGAVQPRKVKEILSTNPDRFTVRLLPSTPPGAEKVADGACAVIARVEVTLATWEPGLVNGEIQVHWGDETRRPLAVPVRGRVANLVEAHPPSLTLPRSSGAGPVYFGNCLCRASAGKELTLQVDSAPPGVTASVSMVEGDPAAKMVRIEWAPSLPGLLSSGGKGSVRLKAWVGDQETTLEIPVHCRARGGDS